MGVLLSRIILMAKVKGDIIALNANDMMEKELL